MSIASEISRLQSAKSSIRTAIENKGVTVGSSLKLDEYAECVDAISSGGGYGGDIDFLLIAGGGGGGSNSCGSGGGGAGGTILKYNTHISSGTYPITIGTGGGSNGNGGNSSGLGYTMYGGGAGGACPRGGSCDGCPGGSGGGGSAGYSGGQCYANGGAACDILYGNEGGRAAGHIYNDCCSAGGGGGGAGSMGQAGIGRLCNGAYAIGGNGGKGIYTDISGTATWYAGGGGGAVRSGTSGTDGCGANNCGGGGHGGGTSGKNGLFILRYPTSCGYNTSGGCKYTCGDYTIHCFTSNGTLTISESQLKEFTEICSIATYTEALTELNKYPQRYYQKFLVEQNIIQYNVDGLLYETLKGIESGGIRYPKYRQVGDYFYMLIYNDNQSQWESLQLE